MIDFPLLALFFVVAVLHSSVGLAGGSSYTAFMAIFGVPLPTIPSISLSLNTLVSSIGSINFYRYRHFEWRLWLPIQLTALPFVYVGSRIQLPAKAFYVVLLVTLLFSLWRMAKMTFATTDASFDGSDTGSTPSLPQSSSSKALPSNSKLNNVKTIGSPTSLSLRLALCTLLGAVLGFLAGSIGIGGGIYLVPSLVLLNLASVRQASAVGVVFILCNSLVGLASKWQLGMVSLSMIMPALMVVGMGGAIGSYLGASRLPTRYVLMALMGVMALASGLLMVKLVQIF